MLLLKSTFDTIPPWRIGPQAHRTADRRVRQSLCPVDAGNIWTL